ncbi:hypothetical protein [Paracoccus sp. PARArs4]|nr:hypothetical protein [Paracoccus sp. PARArs4]
MFIIGGVISILVAGMMVDVTSLATRSEVDDDDLPPDPPESDDALPPT